MQTFLPFPSFSESARVLDNQRLNKQIIEAKQIYLTISGKSQGWGHHPAIKRWRGYPFTLCLYGKNMTAEAKNRGMSPVLFFEDIKTEKEDPPEWVENTKIHSSHRSKLLFKGRIDAVCYSIKKFYKLQNINNWLIEHNYSLKNKLTHSEVESLEEYCKNNKIEIKQNWYKKFGWLEDDSQSYVW